MGVFLNLYECPQECFFLKLFVDRYVYKAEVKTDGKITSTFIFREQSSLTFLVLRSCLDSLGEPGCVVIYVTFGSQCFLCTLSIFDTGSWEHLRQNDYCVLTRRGKFQTLRVLR